MNLEEQRKEAWEKIDSLKLEYSKTRQDSTRLELVEVMGKLNQIDDAILKSKSRH